MELACEAMRRIVETISDRPFEPSAHDSSGYGFARIRPTVVQPFRWWNTSRFRPPSGGRVVALSTSLVCKDSAVLHRRG
jgi:hypothetical protein